ncbi:MAG: hypothetical protein A3F82_06810 [Deltaproteobacteria bacterium RIFCSPLOWO2_12_FULL_44_12]|nr:MAG: hypothetical protein A2712_09645 [Deltaproteobacteria bacterium RIFCSPHIGHO2_01_FULL_43_49]OGQ14920.1 MAG: hypothetical protein A3D22_00040 [Deltaproteobacteria bacterium RIFCSPHIGHO2_02_FULL_44_53]OGQ29576.1 MAG: hypothetical protein A3D98_10375 [Deltaproteobacteria bacterium RIFCSPHIGHO2_12_FULL_44_21]OGQ31032.1 MAG: hypothetical protein A2979_06330 [Deltaproteobacteria bacterium RIFCSPLOWO2_01_FULL_45_74]OGQ42634.1 MAG: hypothetical protein A3I70_02000 [Deltaproteobacteria bacterium 
MVHKEKKHKGHAKAYIKVWVALLVLTIITVVVSYYNFGTWNILVAMLVATVKGALVCLFFMHLLYDNRVNQVVFVSAFAFLGIFVGLTASDELFRTTEKAVVVAQEASTPSGADMNKLRVASPQLVEKGKQLYSVQCAVCHGAAGKGDGPGAPALNPKPRDFTSGYWRFGGQPTHVFKTISEGSPGTAMAAFGTLGVEERWSLVHFVRSIAPNPPDDKPEDLAALGGDKKTDQGPGTMDQGLQKPVQQIPISFAMKRLAKEEMAASDVAVLPEGKQAEGLGEKLYQANCLSCHGLSGKGGVPITRISVNPPVYLKTKDFAKADGAWVNDKNVFVDIVTKGLPGRGKPGIAHFSSGEWDSLYQYVQSLR